VSKKLLLSITSVLLCSNLIQTAYADPLTVYGRANVSLQYADEGNGSFSEVSSNASRAGMKGNMSLDNGMTVLYQIEWEVDLANLSGSDNIKSRDQYVGLRGDFGTVFLGRKNTFTKAYSSQVDLFNDYQGDIKHIWKGENRLSESVSYESMDINGFHFGVNYQTKGSEEGDDGVSLGLRYGDTQLKNSSWNASLTADSDINGYDTQRASVQTKAGSWLLSAMAHRQKKSGQDETQSGLLLSAQYAYAQWKFKSQFQSLQDDNSVSIGADYQLGKSTKTYVWYTMHSLDDKADKSWLAVGLEHRFQN
jgi:predicted porin